MLETNLQPLAVYNEHAAGAHGVGRGEGGVEAGDRGVEGCSRRRWWCLGGTQGSTRHALVPPHFDDSGTHTNPPPPPPLCRQIGPDTLSAENFQSKVKPELTGCAENNNK